MNYVVCVMECVGVKLCFIIICGGIDGLCMFFMGLLCLNIFMGEMGIYSCQEYVSI